MKRGYSKAFTPKTDRRVQLLIDRIPPTLYDAVKAKAKREGVSLRALVLGWLKEWVAHPDARRASLHIGDEPSDRPSQTRAADPDRSRYIGLVSRLGGWVNVCERNTMGVNLYGDAVADLRDLLNAVSRVLLDEQDETTEADR